MNDRLAAETLLNENKQLMKQILEPTTSSISTRTSSTPNQRKGQTRS